MVNATPLPRRFTFYPVLACFLGALLFAGCGKPADAPRNQATTTTNSAQPPPPEVAGPGPGEKVCFACKGEGTVACRVPGCVNGQVDCPGPCLKLSHGTWIHMDVPGHGPNELWQKFPDLDGRGGYYAFSQNHLGEVIVYQNVRAVSTGKCKICGGTGKVKCDVCKGTGKVTCPICNGKKFIPGAWTPTDNPWFNSQPDVIRLADGQVLLGRVAASAGGERTIITRDKKILHVKTSDILPRADTNSPAAPASPAK
jgi:hypothetical protein